MVTKFIRLHAVMDRMSSYWQIQAAKRRRGEGCNACSARNIYQCNRYSDHDRLHHNDYALKKKTILHTVRLFHETEESRNNYDSLDSIEGSQSSVVRFDPTACCSSSATSRCCSACILKARPSDHSTSLPSTRKENVISRDDGSKP